MFQLNLKNSVSGKEIFSVYTSRKACNEALQELTNELLALYKYYRYRSGSACSAHLLKRNQSKMHLSLYDNVEIDNIFCSIDIEIKYIGKETLLYACHYTASDLAYYLVSFTR